ncbi:hypothetical protein ILUMI_26365 [Ignelater luminosus]|uniref:PRANC domain-containing protein n=1 Tax=Ignelater luminosus TaxID=2038154 RepID=A0A8K0FZ18_IGNLU|nr:hypothetical protein ILUMI_26365 [Ignelater luminosus]
MHHISNSDSEDEILYDYIETDNAVISPMNYDDLLLTSPLLRAIRANDVETAASYIKSGRYLRGIDNRARTPLLEAVTQQKYVLSLLYALELLLIFSKYVDVDKDATDFGGTSPLHLAAERASNAIVMRLLEEGCNVNSTDNFKQTPLHVAVKRPSIFVAHELVKRGADINRRDFNDFTPLHEAVECNNLESVCMLLYYGADVNICCTSNLNPFMRAVNDISRLEVATTLFEYYTDFSTKASDGYTALLLAANSLSPLAIDIVKAGVDVDCIPRDKKTLLFFSLYYSDASLFKEVWYRMNFEYFLHYCETFLLKFIDECRFSTEEWVHCMYIILDSSIILNLIDKCLKGTKRWDDRFFQYLIMSFYRRQVPLNDRVAIILSFLSYGIKITLEEIDMAISIYGFQEEVDVFINCASISKQRGQDDLYFPFSFFILGLELDCIIYIVKLFKKHLRYLQSSIVNKDIRKRLILRALGFFSFPYRMKQQIIHSIDSSPELKEAVTERLKVIPEMPTLVELTRNEIRNIIRENEETIELCRFYKAVNKLPVPNVLKNILLFKDCLYP